MRRPARALTPRWIEEDHHESSCLETRRSRCARRRDPRRCPSGSCRRRRQRLHQPRAGTLFGDARRVRQGDRHQGQRHLLRAGPLRAHQGRGREQPSRRADHRRHRPPAAGARSRHRAAGALRGAGLEHPGQSARSGGPLVRALAARPHGLCLERARAGHRDDLRGPRRPEVERQALHPLLPAPVQHRPRRGFPRPARRREDRGMAARRQGQPRQEAVRRRPRRGEGHRRRRLRYRPRQPVLCRPDDERRRRAEEMGGGDPCHPAERSRTAARM